MFRRRLLWIEAAPGDRFERGLLSVGFDATFDDVLGAVLEAYRYDDPDHLWVFRLPERGVAEARYWHRTDPKGEKIAGFDLIEGHRWPPSDFAFGEISTGGEIWTGDPILMHAAELRSFWCVYDLGAQSTWRLRWKGEKLVAGQPGMKPVEIVEWPASCCPTHPPVDEVWELVDA